MVGSERAVLLSVVLGEARQVEADLQAETGCQVALFHGGAVNSKQI